MLHSSSIGNDDFASGWWNGEWLEIDGAKTRTGRPERKFAVLGGVDLAAGRARAEQGPWILGTESRD